LKQLLATHQQNSPAKSINNDSDFQEEDFEQSGFYDNIDTKSFSKHGFDMILIFKSLAEPARINKRAVGLFQAREHESSYSGLVKQNESVFV
jgi:hypothetical protein